MAISRMQQPRQNYGLGSFVKKAVGKITKPFTKVAQKIVPKEIAGIMRKVAPFLPPGYREAAYLLGTAKQTGRISPMDLALTAAPTVGKIPFGKEQLSAFDRIGGVNVPFTGGKDISEVLVGKEATMGPEELVEGFGQARRPIPGTETEGIFGAKGKMYQVGNDDVGILDTKAGQKLFGTYNKKTESYDPSYLKIGSLGLSTADYINTQKELEKLNEGASQVVDETEGGGITDSEAYDQFVGRLAILDPESFRVPEQFRLKSGGRVDFRGGGMDMGNAANQAQSAAMGNTTSSSSKSSNTGGGNLGGGGGGQDSQYRQYRPSTPGNVTVTTPTITDNNDRDDNRTSLIDRTFTKDNLKKIATNQIRNLAFKKFMNVAGLGQYTSPVGIAFALKKAYDAYNKPKDDALALGLTSEDITVDGGMLNNSFMENQIGPRVIEAENAYYNQNKMPPEFLGDRIRMNMELGNARGFMGPGFADGGLMRTNYALGADEKGVVNPFLPKPIGPTLPEEDKPYRPKPTPSKMADMESYSDYYKNLDLEKALRTFRMLKERDPEDMEELIQFFKDRKINAADGGLMRENFALGTRPTDQESGLGGLPIEADMRYTGGFMPYGAVEKADDVPARLSKNEFVFTADAVRAAGGGSVQQGAKKMYDTMKQLEQQPEAKGAMA